VKEVVPLTEKVTTFYCLELYYSLLEFHLFLWFLDILNIDSINEIAQNLSSLDSANEMCELFEKINKEKTCSKDGVTASVLQTKDKKDRLFNGIYNWHLYTKKDTKSDLANLLRFHQFTMEAQEIFPFCEFFLYFYCYTITILSTDGLIRP